MQPAHIENTISECLKACEDIIKEAVEYGAEGIPEKMLQYSEEIIDAQQEFRLYSSVVSDNRNIDDPQIIEEKVAEKRALQMGSLAIEKRNTIERLRGLIRKEQDDEEIEVVADSGQRLICPLSNQYPNKPVYSSKCQHVYEHDLIVNYINTNGRGGRVVCPKAGCNQVVSLRDLVEDPNLTRQVQEARQNEEASRNWDTLE